MVAVGRKMFYAFLLNYCFCFSLLLVLRRKGTSSQRNEPLNIFNHILRFVLVWRNRIAVCVVCRAIRQVGEHIYLWANCWSSRHSLRPSSDEEWMREAATGAEVDEPHLFLSGNKLSTIRPLRVKRDFYWASSSSVISPRPIFLSDEWGNSEVHGPAMLWVAGSFLWNI